MRRLLFLVLAILLLFVAGGCGGAANDATAPTASDGSSQYGNQTANMSTDQMEKAKAEEEARAGATQKIITTVNLVMIVADVNETVSKVEQILQEVNGYVQDADFWFVNDRPRGNFTLRLPVEKVDETLPRLEALGQVERKNISGQDVTEEYYDVEARKNNLQKQEERYLELLSKANTVKDMLEIENELARIRGEIESFEARLKVLDNRVNLATINLELRSPQGLSTGQTLKDPFGQRIQTGWQRGVNGMINLVQDLFVFLVILLPYTPILAVGGYLIYRLYKIRVARKNGNKGKD